MFLVLGHKATLALFTLPAVRFASAAKNHVFNITICHRPPQPATLGQLPQSWSRGAVIVDGEGAISRPSFPGKKTVEAEGSINTPVIVKALAATQSFIFQGANFSQLALRCLGHIGLFLCLSKR